MKNVEKLKARIEEFKNDKTYPGYICIGCGDPVDLSCVYDLSTKEIYALRDDDKKFISGWAGCFSSLKYYISEDFAIRNGLYYSVSSLEEELHYAKQMVDKFDSEKHDLYDRVNGANENFAGELRWEIRHKNDHSKLSGRATAYMKKHKKEWVVVLVYGGCIMPAAELELREKPTQEVVILNDNYNAVVTGGEMVLGMGSEPTQRYYIKEQFARETGLVEFTADNLEKEITQAHELLETLKKESGNSCIECNKGTRIRSEVTKVGVRLRNKSGNSQRVNDWFTSNPTRNVCVVFTVSSIAIPWVHFIKPKTVEVKLNESYTATVSKEHIVVGCQTIELKAIRELNNALKQLGVTLD